MKTKRKLYAANGLRMTEYPGLGDSPEYKAMFDKFAAQRTATFSPAEMAEMNAHAKSVMANPGTTALAEAPEVTRTVSPEGKVAYGDTPGYQPKTAPPMLPAEDQVARQIVNKTTALSAPGADLRNPAFAAGGPGSAATRPTIPQDLVTGINPVPPPAAVPYDVGKDPSIRAVMPQRAAPPPPAMVPPPAMAPARPPAAAAAPVAPILPKTAFPVAAPPPGAAATPVPTLDPALASTAEILAKSARRDRAANMNYRSVRGATGGEVLGRQVMPPMQPPTSLRAPPVPMYADPNYQRPPGYFNGGEVKEAPSMNDALRRADRMIDTNTPIAAPPVAAAPVAPPTSTPMTPPARPISSWMDPLFKKPDAAFQQMVERVPETYAMGGEVEDPLKNTTIPYALQASAGSGPSTSAMATGLRSVWGSSPGGGLMHRSQAPTARPSAAPGGGGMFGMSGSRRPRQPALIEQDPLYARGGEAPHPIDAEGTGGPIHGEGGPKDDKVDLKVSAGEYVLSAKAKEAMQRLLGGPDELDNFVQNANGGAPPKKLGDPSQGMRRPPIKAAMGLDTIPDSELRPEYRARAIADMERIQAIKAAKQAEAFAGRRAPGDAAAQDIRRSDFFERTDPPQAKAAPASTDAADDFARRAQAKANYEAIDAKTRVSGSPGGVPVGAAKEGRIMSGVRGLGKWGGWAGTGLAAGLAGKDVYDVSSNPATNENDVKAELLGKGIRGLGALAGGAVGSFVAPGVGTGIGASLGYAGADTLMDKFGGEMPSTALRNKQSAAAAPPGAPAAVSTPFTMPKNTATETDTPSMRRPPDPRTIPGSPESVAAAEERMWGPRGFVMNMERVIRPDRARDVAMINADAEGRGREASSAARLAQALSGANEKAQDRMDKNRETFEKRAEGFFTRSVPDPKTGEPKQVLDREGLNTFKQQMSETIDPKKMQKKYGVTNIYDLPREAQDELMKDYYDDNLMSRNFAKQMVKEQGMGAGVSRDLRKFGMPGPKGEASVGKIGLMNIFDRGIGAGNVHDAYNPFTRDSTNYWVADPKTGERVPLSSLIEDESLGSENLDAVETLKGRLAGSERKRRSDLYRDEKK